jgi:hypothetical protein
MGCVAELDLPGEPSPFSIQIRPANEEAVQECDAA